MFLLFCSLLNPNLGVCVGPVTELDKRNKTMSKKIHDNFMSENCDVIVIFWVFGQFGAVPKLDSGHRICF